LMPNCLRTVPLAPSQASEAIPRYRELLAVLIPLV
jgi:hypothetical protein